MRLCNACTAMLMTSSPLGSLQMNWEDELVPKYLTSGCGYMKARGAQCCQQFSQEYVTLVCQKMLHFLRSIRIKRFKNLTASSKGNGLSPCVHGNSRKLPHNTFSLSSTWSLYSSSTILNSTLYFYQQEFLGTVVRTFNSCHQVCPSEPSGECTTVQLKQTIPSTLLHTPLLISVEEVNTISHCDEATVRSLLAMSAKQYSHHPYVKPSWGWQVSCHWECTGAPLHCEDG